MASVLSIITPAVMLNLLKLERNMSHVYIGPTELFVAAWCDPDEHVKAWRWYWYTRGIEIKKEMYYR